MVSQQSTLELSLAERAGWLNDGVPGCSVQESLIPLAEAGRLARGVPESLGGVGGTLLDVVETIATVSEQCLTSGFVFWCQRVMIEYLVASDNRWLQNQLLPKLLKAEVAGATGLSNAMKHSAGIEPLQIKASLDAGMITLNGFLPWASNLQPDNFVVAIAGSPSHPSRTHSLLEYSLQLLQQQGIQTDIVSVREIPAEDLVFGRYDSSALEHPKALIEKADGLIIATPIYKASYTGVLKAFLDLLPQKALLGKVILPLATGGTIAHLLALDYALKPVLSELGALHFISNVYAIDKQIQRQQDGSVQLDADLEQRLKEALQDFTTAINALQSASTKEFARA